MSLKEVTESTTIADRFLLVALIIISIAGFIFIKKAFPKGADVMIEINGKPAYQLPINTNTTISVKGMIGDTIIEIKDRKVRIKESACPNKTCIHNGWIDRGVIICLPNRVTVTIGNSEEKKTIDAITG